MVRIKHEKVVIIPNIIPKGLLFPPVDDEESTIGSSGQIHGASMVNNPDTKVKNSKTIIVLYASLCERFGSTQQVMLLLAPHWQRATLSNMRNPCRSGAQGHLVPRHAHGCRTSSTGGPHAIPEQHG